MPTTVYYCEETKEHREFQFREEPPEEHETDAVQFLGMPSLKPVGDGQAPQGDLTRPVRLRWQRVR